MQSCRKRAAGSCGEIVLIYQALSELSVIEVTKILMHHAFLGHKSRYAEELGALCC